MESLELSKKKSHEAGLRRSEYLDEVKKRIVRTKKYH